LQAVQSTRYELRVDLEEWLKLKPKVHDFVDSRCTDCELDGKTNIANLVFKGQFQACYCNGHVAETTVEGKARLDRMIAESRFDWRDYDNRFASVHTSHSYIELVCRDCGKEASTKIYLMRQFGFKCVCQGKAVQYSSPDGQEVLEQLVEASRFVWDDEDNLRDSIVDCTSRVGLVCTVCSEKVTPTIDKLKQNNVGCGCTNSTELKALRFARVVCEQCFPERDLVVAHKHRDPTLRNGAGTHMLELDLVVFERIDGRLVPLLLIEIDGRHHFDPNHRYGTGEDHRERHTFEHDVLKEEHALNVKASMARLEQRTVESDKANWKAWLQGKIKAAINRELPHHIYRLSAGQQYVSGEYAARRKGTRIDSELPAGESYIATGILVDVAPMPEPVKKQRTIDQMFAARDSPLGM